MEDDKKNDDNEVQNEESQDEVRKELEQAGVKEFASNPEAIAEEMESEVDDIEKDALPSFFVQPNEEKIRIGVDIIYSKKNGKILNIVRSNSNMDFSKFKVLGYTQEWAEFTQPTYDEIATYRQKSFVFDESADRMVLDVVKMRNCFIIWHLKDWSLRDVNGNKVELEHSNNGSLNVESIKKIYNVFPTLLDVFLTLFEKDAFLAR